MSFEIEGKIHKIFETQSKTDSFQAREFVITTDGQYPQFIKFQLTQDRCQIIDNVSEGEMIKVFFDLRGREWNEKYFTNLNAWKIEKAAVAAPAESPSIDDAGFPPVEMPSNGAQETKASDFDDLPF